jgi:hypothetical protein
MGEGVKTRRGGTPPPIYLYQSGNECAGITGGWVEQLVGTPTSHSLTKNVGNMVLSINAINSSTLNSASTVSPIVWGKYTKLKAIVDVSNPAQKEFGLKVADSAGASNIAAVSTSVLSATDKLLSVDVGAITGSYKVHLYAYSNNTTAGTLQVTIKRIWLE